MSIRSFTDNTLNVIELFAGAAGLAQGFLRSGHYQALALFDILPAAQASYRNRYPWTSYECCDVLDLTARDILRVVQGKRIHGVLGGPPCQGFSLAGLKNPRHDKNALVGRYAFLVRQLRPDFLLMENVPQLLYHEQFANLLHELRDEYEITYAILNAAQYGVPQTRHRLFVLAYHQSLFALPTWPAPTHGQPGQLIFSYRSKKLLPVSPQTEEEILGADQSSQKAIQRLGKIPPPDPAALHPFVTVGDALSDLSPALCPGARHQPYPQPALTAYQRLLRADATEVTNHIPRRHTGNPLHIVRAMPEGGSLEDVSRDLWPLKKSTYYSQAYGRLHRQGLARTLTTYFQNAGSGRFYHYAEPRTLTVREAARLQGFDDRFEFLGALDEQMLLVGNAVPLPLAEALARHIYSQIGARLLATNAINKEFAGFPIG